MRTFTPVGICAALLLACVAPLGCGTHSESSAETAGTGGAATSGDQLAHTRRGDAPYKIVATCGMVADIVRQVAASEAAVTALMGEGVDPHLYKPTRHDVKLLRDADVVFYSGLMLEGRMGDTFAKVARGGKPIFAVTEGIDESYLREPPEFHGHWDPHVWMDVTAWSECVKFVGESLAEYDPAHAKDYGERAAEYRKELVKLDQYIKQVIKTIPLRQRLLITAHDAFGYFSRAYKIPVLSVQGVTTESEAGIDDINRLVDQIVENKVQAIFIESSVSPKSIQAVIEGAASKGRSVKIGGKLYSDAMGPAGSYEGTYIGMLDHNATLIARALGGKAPQRGMNGRLSEAESGP